VSQREKDKKKQRVLHTRVSEDLDEELREKAAGLGVSVSNLVRNILLNTVEMVEDLVADGSSIARAAGKEKPSAPTEEAPRIELLGWQDLQLHRNALCETCNEVLPKGSNAKVAVFSGPTDPVFRCATCVEVPTDVGEEPS
jgi:hypothetical protein